jgi:hypothetical protein
MDDEIHECTGCYIWENDIGALCSHTPFDSGKLVCPCVTCLVKTMCSDDQCCEAFAKVYKETHKTHKETHMDEYEDCIGCYLGTRNDKNQEDKNVHTCDLHWVNDEGTICPCTICLIKGMCKKSCEEFKVFDGWSLSAALKDIDNA